MSRGLKRRDFSSSLLQAAATTTAWPDNTTTTKTKTISARLHIGQTPDEAPLPPPMSINLSVQPADASLPAPTLTIVLNIEDEVSDFSLGSAIGSIQTMLDAFSASSATPLPVSVRIADPTEDRRLVIKVQVNDVHQLPPGPLVDLNLSQALPCCELSLTLGQCFESLCGQDSKVLVFGERCTVDVASKIEMTKGTCQLLKRTIQHYRQRTSGNNNNNNSSNRARFDVFARLPFLLPLLLHNINVEVNFDSIFEVLDEVLAEQDSPVGTSWLVWLAWLNGGRGGKKSAATVKNGLELLKRIQGWHLAQWLTVPCRTGKWSKEMPRSAQKLYQIIKNTFSGFHSITLDMGGYNQNVGPGTVEGEEKTTTTGTTNGIHGGAVHCAFQNFNPFRVLPNIDPSFYGGGASASATGLNDWFETFQDPVLRAFVALFRGKPVPKDFLVDGAIEQVLVAKTSGDLIVALEYLRELVHHGGAVLSMGSLLKVVKEKRLAVGDEVWNKNVAKSFGEVLQAVKNGE